MILAKIGAAAICVGTAFGEGTLAEVMPRKSDWSSMWWAEGFPGVVEGAKWHRVIETGKYAMVLDTERLTIPHFGALEGKDWRSLPAAQLDLSIEVNGKSYECAGSKGWSRHGGPRLVEAGAFFQRGDVTDLIFKSKEGDELSVEARFETAAWADRLGLILEAGPGIAPVKKGEDSFGKVGGGFGLDGTNELALSDLGDFDPNSFTWSFWAYLPEEYDSKTTRLPWLMCQGPHESADGHVGVTLRNGQAEATLNIGGGRDNRVGITSENVKVGQWNHFLLSYDGTDLRFFLNGKQAEGGKVGKVRAAKSLPLTFGRRGDGFGDGYHFYGVLDELELYAGIVSPGELGKKEALKRWGFREDGLAMEAEPRHPWVNPSLKVGLTQGGRTLEAESGGKAELVIDPVAFEEVEAGSLVKVSAGDCPVEFEGTLGWHRVDLDGVKPLGKGNDVIERIPLTVSNPSDEEQIARVMFAKSGRGMRGRLGTPITGISAILCHENGEPTGIPVQLSKNWHNEAAAGVYKGTWFHGITQLRLAAGQEMKLQLVIANGHWGGVAAASHAQLSLIGWGSNQRWEQSALGCWGESICYEPAQGQGKCTITDVRPLMVTPMNGKAKWGWTSNVGGGDFLRFFDAEGTRQFHQAMRTRAFRQGPCLTEVEYSGKIGEEIAHSVVTSLARTDDLVRGTYRIKMTVSEAVNFSRLVLFQVGADTYNFTSEGRFVFGDESGMKLKRKTEPGGDVYRTEPISIPGKTRWVSLEEGRPGTEKKANQGAWANRGIIVREWKARLGGKEAEPHFAERGTTRGRAEYSTLDLVPPAGVTRLEKGDFLEAVIEYIVMPQKGEDYYGPNLSLKAALEKDGGTWKMIEREVTGNDRKVELVRGSLVGLFPDVRVACEGDHAQYELAGGLGYLPVTFTNLSRSDGYVLKVDGQAVDQAVHGRDFWQTDYDPLSMTWSRTYNLPRDAAGAVKVEFTRE